MCDCAAWRCSTFCLSKPSHALPSRASHTLAAFFFFFITRGTGLAHALVDVGVVREQRRRGGGVAAEEERGWAGGHGASIADSSAAGVCERSMKGWAVLACGEGGASGSSCLMGMMGDDVRGGESSGSSAVARGSL